VREARRLRSELSGTLAALRSGRICPRRARVIVDGTAVVSPEQARRVEAKVLPRAERLTSAKLRQAVEKQIAADDPDGAEDRHVAAVQRRDVCSFPLPDGLAEIVATLSAEDAAAVMAALNAAAVAMKAADPSDPRTIAQRRADALAEMGWGALASGWLGHDPRTCRRAGPAPDAGPHSDFTAGGADAPAGGADDPSGDVADSAGAAPAEPSGGCGCGGRRLARGRGDRPVSVVVTVPLSTVIGLDDQPAELAGYGPIRRRWPAGWPPMEPGGDWSPTRCPGRCYAGSGRRGDQRGWSRPGMLALPPGQDPHRQAGRTTRTRSIRVDRSGWASVHRRPRTRRADHRRSPPRQTAIGPTRRR
jgi:Domain of unknown function (DUF222)